LFRDAPTLTRGRYYFTPAGVPFCPIPTLVGSQNWTTTERLEYDPPLGEVNPADTFARPYHNGSAPFPLPAVELIGTKDCISNGERIINPTVHGSLYQGLNSRHLPSGSTQLGNGLACWLRYETLPTGLFPLALSTWPDSSGYGRDGIMDAFPPFACYVVNDFVNLQPRVGIFIGGGISWPTSIRMGRQFSIYLAGRFWPDSVTSEMLFRSNIDPPDVGHRIYLRANDWSVHSGIADVTGLSVPDQSNKEFVVSLRRDHGHVWLHWLGLGQGDRRDTAGPEVCQHLNNIRLIGLIAPVLLLGEVIVFDHKLTDSHHADVMSYLGERYPPV